MDSCLRRLFLSWLNEACRLAERADTVPTAPPVFGPEDWERVREAWRANPLGAVEARPAERWVATRPHPVRRLMRDFPPSARVVARPGRAFMVPAPGVVGRVSSYFEDGTVGVVAPLPAGITNRLGVGPLVSGQCPPEALVVVGYESDPLGRPVNRAWVDRALVGG
jgi:hypothetical protein